MCIRCSVSAVWVGCYYLNGQRKFPEICASLLYLFQKKKRKQNPRLHSCLAQYKKIKSKRKLSKSRRRKSWEKTQAGTGAPKSQVRALVFSEDAQYLVSSLRLPSSDPASLPFFFSATLPPHFLPHTTQLHGNRETLYPNPLQRGPTSPPLDPKQFSFTADGLKKKNQRTTTKKISFPYLLGIPHIKGDRKRVPHRPSNWRRRSSGKAPQFSYFSSP